MAGGAVADKVTGVHETGAGLTKPGTAILHGTEAVFNKDAMSDMTAMDSLGGIMLASTTQYINSVGPIAAPIAPVFKGMAGQLAKEYDIPATVAQTNVGGSLPQLDKELKKAKEKKKLSPEEELDAIGKDLLETQDENLFAEKLLKIIDPEGKFQELLRNVNRPTVPPGSGGEVGADPFVLLGGSQDPGQPGIDFTLKGTQNRAVLAGTVIEIGHQYNPNSTGGDGRKGAGYGNYVVIRSTNPVDGSQVDMLYAHFPKGEIKVKEGDQISVGQDLGRMATTEEYENPTTRREVGSGTGPHTSLDFFQAGTRNTPHPKARELGDYILKELGKGPEGAIEKARQQAYTQQQQNRPAAGPLPTAQGLGKQGAVDNKNFGATSGVGSKGYLIVPGHAAGGGAPEEKKLVKQLARNAYNNVKSKFPDANVHYQDTDGMFADTDEGFKKQLEWFKQKEKEGWEILEIHMDASIESGQGTGRGVIAPTGELNPVEAYFAQNYGAFTRGHRDLGAPKRGVGLFELGNMSPELQQAARENKVSKQQLDALTAPLERALQVGLNVAPPSTQRPRFESLQGKDNDNDTKYLIVNQPQQPTTPLPGGGAFVEMSPGRWRTSDELSTTMRNLYIQKLGQ
jgi:murein DD-endopeptidase MepM/ murein hydrolase activator NlpD